MTEGDELTGMLYQIPHEDILSLADVSPSPVIRFNKSCDVYVALHRSMYKSIEELSQNEIKLAGLRINPENFINSRELYYHNVTLHHVGSDEDIAIEGLPSGKKMSRFVWNHSQTAMAFVNVTDKGVELWMIDIQTAKCRRISGPELNANIGTTFLWMKDDKSILVSCKPSNLKELISKDSRIPVGPTVSENNGQKAQVRTYQDLLKDAIDETNFTILATSEIKQFYLDDSPPTSWKECGIYDDLSLSPDGNYLMVTEILRPFSYLVQYDRFPMSTYIYTSKGQKIQTIVENPLLEELPKGFMAVMKGRRGLRWRADHPATVEWLEAYDLGDPELDVPFRDGIFQWEAPFIDESRLIFKTVDRFAGIIWGNENLAMVYEQWWSNRLLRMVLINPSNPEQSPIVFNERNIQDNYSDPGSFVTCKNEYGFSILYLLNGKLILSGEGYTAEGKYPFLDEYNLAEQSINRVYQASNELTLETLMNKVEVDGLKFLTRIESRNVYPNYYIRDIANGTLNQITHFLNPFDILQDLHKEVIKYKREDGVELSATLYLPLDYNSESDSKYPMIMWAYPREFKDKYSAGQVSSSSNEFTYPFYGSPLYWVNRGYVILEDASMPVIGEGDQEPNDTYVQQLVLNAKAAIEAVDALGYIDKKRVAIGGHSYGAFMTATLLSSCDLFAAGIARSGAYNRTLTPFGFQSEERNLWEATDIYMKMSPFLNADKMKTPLLLIHGEDDNNSGTHTMQSERYFNALKGLGATVRLVILPRESHGYSAKESILHMLWEQDQWLEKYLKSKN